MFRAALVGVALLCLSRPLLGQQPDTTFQYRIESPAYRQEAGPIICVDAAHLNAHNASGTYAPFANLLRTDGYRVQSLDGPWTREALAACAGLVSVNAVAPENAKDRSYPHPSAFSTGEIDTVVEWVNAGGALLLIADHAPFAGAVADLAVVFGFGMLDAFAGPGEPGAVIAVFGQPKVAESAWRQYASDRKIPFTPIQGSLANPGTLAPHAITRGREAAERVEWVVTFTGSVFLPSRRVEPLLVFGPRAGAVTDRPDNSPFPVGGWLQAGAARFGQGRVVVIGEAAMCTAQVGGPQRIPTGMNAPEAPYNAQFCLNVVHWMTGLLDKTP